jgi:hypothetical protein
MRTPGAGVGVVTLLCVAACAGDGDRPGPGTRPAGTAEAPANDQEWLRRGAATLAPFKERLLAALKEGLERGAGSAIQVCRIRAPELAAAAGSATVRVGRSSHRLRNPANAPRPWMEPILAEYRAEGGSRAPRVVGLPDGGTGYAEPIFVQPICLQCHGETLRPEVRDRLRELYPDDRAVDFRGGEFRGIFWVEFARGGSAVPGDPSGGPGPSAKFR